MGINDGLWIVQAGLMAHEWSCIAIVPHDEDRHGKHFITKAEQKANANLFSAGPQMLEALRYAESRCVSEAAYPHASLEDRKLRDLVVAAIAAAEGSK